MNSSARNGWERWTRQGLLLIGLGQLGWPAWAAAPRTQILGVLGQLGRPSTWTDCRGQGYPYDFVVLEEYSYLSIWSRDQILRKMNSKKLAKDFSKFGVSKNLNGHLVINYVLRQDEHIGYVLSIKDIPEGSQICAMAYRL